MSVVWLVSSYSAASLLLHLRVSTPLLVRLYTPFSNPHDQWHLKFRCTASKYNSGRHYHQNEHFNSPKKIIFLKYSSKMRSKRIILIEIWEIIKILKPWHVMPLPLSCHRLYSPRKDPCVIVWVLFTLIDLRECECQSGSADVLKRTHFQTDFRRRRQRCCYVRARSSILPIKNH